MLRAAKLLCGVTLAAAFVTPAWADFEFTDLACETTATTGTGTVDLAGAISNYLGFIAAGIDTGDTVPYHIVSGDGKMETGIGTVTDGTPDTMTRVAQWSTDGSGAELSLSGTSNICIGPITAVWANADKGDITTSNGFQTWVVDADSIALTTDTTGNYVLDVADGTGIDGTAAGEGATYTPTFDATELTGTTTFGAGAAVVVAADLQSTDDVIVGDDINLASAGAVIDFNGGLTFTENGGDVEVSGGDLILDGNSLVSSDASSQIILNPDVNASYVGIDVVNDNTGGTADARIRLASGTTADFILRCDSSNNGCEFSTITGIMEFASASTLHIGVNGIRRWNWDINGNMVPQSDAAYDIGSSAVGIDDLFLGPSGVIDFDSDVQITHSANDLAFTGVTGDYSFDDTVGPDGDNTRDLGSAAATWATAHINSIELADGTANTLTCSAGDCSIEGNGIYRAGGTDVAVADGGTGASALTNLITLTTHTTGDYVATVADGTGVDGTATGEGSTYTPSLDFAEIGGSLTWGTGTSNAITYNGSGIDVTLDFSTGNEMTLRTADPGNFGPNIFCDHNSASAIANDVICEYAFNGNDDAGADQRYVSWSVVIDDASAASPDGRLNINTTVANVATGQMRIKDGVTIGTAGDSFGGSGVLSVDDSGAFRLYETEANGDHSFQLIAPDALAGDVTCTIDASGKIPDSCVGDGSDSGGTLADADYTDITVSGSGLVWNLDADVVTPAELAEAGDYDFTGTVTLDADALQLDDTNASHQLIITPGSDLAADRVLTLTTGDSARTVTISGDTTISQDYSSTGNPTFAAPTVTTLELAGNTANTLSAAAGVLSIEGAALATTTAEANSKIDTIGVTIDGGGSAITSGVKGYISIPYNATINSVVMLSNATAGANCEIDVWKDTYANYPPVDADSLVNSNEPLITSGQIKSEDTNLGDWTSVTITAGDVIGFNVDTATCTSITRLHINLKVTKT